MDNKRGRQIDSGEIAPIELKLVSDELFSAAQELDQLQLSVNPEKADLKALELAREITSELKENLMETSGDVQAFLQIPEAADNNALAGIILSQISSLRKRVQRQKTRLENMKKNAA